VKAPSGKSYVINGYVNDQHQVERVETWLGENIMGDMQILATYTGWKDFGGAMAAREDRADARRMAVLRSGRDGREGEPPDLAALAPAPAPAGGRGGAPAAAAAAARSATA
jgi:hypothetical protein